MQHVFAQKGWLQYVYNIQVSAFQAVQPFCKWKSEWNMFLHRTHIKIFHIWQEVWFLEMLSILQSALCEWVHIEILFEKVSCIFLQRRSLPYLYQDRMLSACQGIPPLYRRSLKYIFAQRWEPHTMFLHREKWVQCTSISSLQYMNWMHIEIFSASAKLVL